MHCFLFRRNWWPRSQFYSQGVSFQHLALSLSPSTEFDPLRTQTKSGLPRTQYGGRGSSIRQIWHEPHLYGNVQPLATVETTSHNRVLLWGSARFVCTASFDLHQVASRICFLHFLERALKHKGVKALVQVTCQDLNLGNLVTESMQSITMDNCMGIAFGQSKVCPEPSMSLELVLEPEMQHQSGRNCILQNLAFKQGKCHDDR